MIFFLYVTLIFQVAGLESFYYVWNVAYRVMKRNETMCDVFTAHAH